MLDAITYHNAKRLEQNIHLTRVTAIVLCCITLFLALTIIGMLALMGQPIALLLGPLGAIPLTALICTICFSIAWLFNRRRLNRLIGPLSSRDDYLRDHDLYGGVP